MKDSCRGAAAWWAIMLSQGLRFHHDQGVISGAEQVGLIDSILNITLVMGFALV